MPGIEPGRAVDKHSDLTTVPLWPHGLQTRGRAIVQLQRQGGLMVREEQGTLRILENNCKAAHTWSCLRTTHVQTLGCPYLDALNDRPSPDIRLPIPGCA